MEPESRYREMPACYNDNETLACIARRSSTRAFDPTRPPTEEQRAAVLHAASRAPSAGAMMLYSIIDIQERTTLERLAVLCDDQPFIAKAPWALVFVADYAKWMDLFAALELAADEPRGIRPPGRGELAIAAQDAVAAAQTAVIAAEAVGLGSCYIGDVVENAEDVAELLDLPPYTLPLSMLVIGTPAKERPVTPHAVENLVMSERYRRADAATRAAQVVEMDALYRPHATEPGARVQDIYHRKHMSAFMAEMDRSLARWCANWTGEGSLRV